MNNQFEPIEISPEEAVRMIQGHKKRLLISLPMSILLSAGIAVGYQIIAIVTANRAQAASNRAMANLQEERNREWQIAQYSSQRSVSEVLEEHEMMKKAAAESSQSEASIIPAILLGILFFGFMNAQNLLRFANRSASERRPPRRSTARRTSSISRASRSSGRSLSKSSRI